MRSVKFTKTQLCAAERQLSNGELTDDLEEPAVNNEQTPESVAAIERNTLSDSFELT